MLIEDVEWGWLSVCAVYPEYSYAYVFPPFEKVNRFGFVFSGDSILDRCIFGVLDVKVRFLEI